MAEVASRAARVHSLRRFLDILDRFAAHAPPRDTSPKAVPARDPAAASTPAVVLADDGSTPEIPLVEVGREFRTPVGRRCLQVIRFVGQGKRARVYQVLERATGRTYALKVIHELTPVQLKSIALETPKAEALASHQLPCARIIEVGPTYVLKEWIDGIPGDKWVREWLERGSAPTDPAFLALLGFFSEAAARGVHVDDLRPSNMMLRRGTEWVPIDTGLIEVSVPPFAAMKRYRERFIRRWLGVRRSPVWSLVYWIWCRARGVDRQCQPQPGL